MGDEQQRELAPPLELEQDGEDLRLDRRVEHRDRLVADQPFRLEHERRRDRHPLALAAGELVRVALAEALLIEPDVLEGAAHALCVLALGHALHPQRLGDDRANPLAWVERLVGILEDHLQAPAELVHVALAVHALAVEGQLAGRGLDQAQHRPGEGRLAAARFADDAEDLPFAPIERDPVDGPGDAALDAELHRQVANLHQNLAAHSLTSEAVAAGSATSGHSLQGA